MLAVQQQKHFDAFRYAQRLKIAGLEPKLADLQAETLNEAVEDMINTFPYATKTDLSELRTDVKADIAELRTDITEFKAEVKAEIQDVKNKVELLEQKVDFLRKDMESGFEKIVINTHLQITQNANKTILWNMATMASLLGVVAKAVHWF